MGSERPRENEDRLKRSEKANLIQPRLFSSKVIETIPEYKSSPFKCNLFYLHSSYFASPTSQCYNHVTASTKPVSTSIGVGWGWLLTEKVFLLSREVRLSVRKRPRFPETSQHFVSDCSLSMLDQKK